MKLLFTFLGVIFGIINAHESLAYNHDSNGLEEGSNNPDWQSKLNDETPINHISYPGTHNTMADDNDNDYVDCQASSLPVQLNAGIRVLGIRCREIDDSFAIHHDSYYLSAMFGDVLNECKDFLSKNPNEYILMRVVQEYSDASDEVFEKVFKTYWDDSRWSSLFYQSSDFKKIPTVGEVRGKIIILQGWKAAGDDTYGFKWSDADIQDEYGVSGNWDLYGKWESIKEQLIKTNDDLNPDKFYINFLSGSTADGLVVFPYFVASGHSNPATGAPRLATGRTSPGWSSWEDFPRVNCALGICTIAFEGTNILTYDYISDHCLQFVGIIMIDFPGQDLIDEIINLNLPQHEFNLDRTDIDDKTLTSKEGEWGNWCQRRYCDNGQYAVGIEFKVESSQGSSDDTAANSLNLICADLHTRDSKKTIAAANEGEWGDWSDEALCDDGQHIIGFKTKVEDNQDGGDDTSLNGIELKCSDQKDSVSPDNNGEWGDWTDDFSECNDDTYVCGYRLKVEGHQGDGLSGGNDDTALNAIELYCCKY